MNEFQIYELLCEMSKLAGHYTDGARISQEIRECADRTASQLYRVAVIGEFKRGKSSMINALLGTEVLPTSVLPMTAAITRVTYSEEKRISVLYKDGTRESATIEQLADFATKRDAERAERASRIKEITVFYPSVFCKNHIDLIDTPGLNDDEAMTAVTLGVVGEIDAAVMVISAQEPLSITEQDLILLMIAEHGIRHIVFVVTYIDAVSDDTDDQDKMIAYIKRRISGDLMKRAASRFAEQPELLEKAERILSAPDIFGVSSVLALQGFIHDSEEMLRLSRFPKFKKELLDLLTAAQSTDIRLNAADYAAELKGSLPLWHANEVTYLNASRDRIIERQKKINAFLLSGDKELTGVKLAFSKGISQLGLDTLKSPAQRDEFVDQPLVKRYKGLSGAYRFSMYEALDNVRDTFVGQLYTIKKDTYTSEAVRAALDSAKKEADKLMSQFGDEVCETVGGQMEVAYDSLCCAMPQETGQEAPDMPEVLRGKWLSEHPFPEPEWLFSPIPDIEVLTGTDIIPGVKMAIVTAFSHYAEAVREYCEEWKNSLAEFYRAAFADKDIVVALANELSEKNAKLLTADIEFKRHTERADAIAAQLAGTSDGEDSNV